MSDVQELNINNTTYDIKAKSVVDTNTGKVKMWTGTKAQYDAITTKDPDTLYNVTDDSALNAGIDNKSITKNSSHNLQTIGIIDQNNTTNAIKTWTGTKAQYDAIVTKDITTLYNITDDSDVNLQLLELLFPVGAVYFGTMATCPLQTLGVGTWQALPSDKVIQIAGARGSVGDTLNESLPNITGTLGLGIDNGDNKLNYVSSTGALTTTSYSGKAGTTGDATQTVCDGVNLDASLASSTYQDDAPVQPDAYLLNGWRRIS